MIRRLSPPARAAGPLLILLLAAGAALAQAPASGADGPQVREAILRGEPPTPPTPPRQVVTLPGGDISLNLPGVDIQAATKVVLGDTLRAPYSIDPTLHNLVTVRTTRPIRRADVRAVFEQALADAGLVLVDRAGTLTIVAAASARGEAPVVGPTDAGYGNETVALKFVGAEEMRRLLDPLVPNAISGSDPSRNVLVISGGEVQRRALRDLIAQFDVDWLRGMSFALFTPQRTDARLIAPELEKLLNAPGAPSAGLVRLIAMDRLNGILAITGQAQYLDDVRRFVEILDREGESAERRVFVYSVQNGRAADLAKVLNGAFGVAGSGAAQTETDPVSLTDHTTPVTSLAPAPALGPGMGPSMGSGMGSGMGQGGLAGGIVGGPPPGRNPAETPAGQEGAAGGRAVTITADETNNAIVVFSTPRDYALIVGALAKLDTPPLQVMIDASISEVTLNHNLQYGIQWSFAAGPNTAALTQGTTSTPVRNFPGLSYLYQGANVSATLNALATVTDVTVLSAPKLTVLNNHTATIEVGDQVPISTGTATSLVSNGSTVNTIEYRDTGIILKITPRVNSGGLVLLDIAQEVSDVTGTTTSTITSPTIEQRKIATSVAVQDGETIALGGLIKNEVTKGRSTIPGLGNIPVLGHLFGDTTGGLVRTELVVLLTPHVVRTPVDARAVTQELRDKIHLAAPPPPPAAKPAKPADHGP